ncbi:hypothetical protein M413DRAFT_26890 [Hebeloma cylindrosporum]|uniref:Endonuclease/exonuclease/phosphatase domain-containing protein n=1 Tax=Hebeloma cylindrosporum TaxID=76867 RepID=A0A0C3CFF9_HEBCY|nr:hypothetical protein M413DRAFT_26890 [Hebeloma cylindrosporum h7]
MNFSPEEFQPFPVTHPTRPETPPLDFDISHPFIGVELIISGLPRDSLVAAQNHLQNILRQLKIEYPDFPLLDIVSPSNVEPLDYVWASLADPFKEPPRPDMLDKVRGILNGIEGLCARWRMSSSRIDKSRQVYFQAEEGANLVTLKTKFDRILNNRKLDTQSSWIPKDSRRIFYQFLAHDAFAQLMNKPLEVDRRFYHPRRTRYIQPKMGLEVAVNGIAGHSGAKSLINRHLEQTYADGSGDPVVRDSRVELDGMVYCAILRTPAIAARFLSDPFSLFSNTVVKATAPQYLYELNSQGVPIPSYTSNYFNPPQESAPQFQQQLDTLSANADSVNATLQQVIQQQNDTEDRYQRDRTNLIDAFKETTNVYYLTNLVNSAQSQLNTLQNSLDHQESLKLLLPAEDPRIRHLDNRISKIQEKISEAEAHKKDLTTQLDAKQLTLNASSPTAKTLTASITPVDTAQDEPMPPAHPTPSVSGASHKRPRLESATDDVREPEQREVMSMLVDSEPQVCPPPSSYSYPFSSSLASPATHNEHRVTPLKILPTPPPPNRPILNSLRQPFLLNPVSQPFVLSNSVPRLFILSFLLLILLPLVSASVPLSSTSLRIVSINVNGLAHEMKIGAVENMVDSLQPDALVIGETKTSHRAARRLSLKGYELHENSGRSTGRKSAKWGVIVAIRRGLFNIQLVPMHDALRGRAVALDLLIPTTNHKAFSHRLIGVYAPWNPGGTEDDEHHLNGHY